MGQRKAIVVGSGAGGCMAARELASCGYNVMLIEAGGDFKPFTKNMDLMEPARRAGLFFDERLIQLLFPAMRVDKAQDGMAHVRGRAVGGTTALATGNACATTATLPTSASTSMQSLPNWSTRCRRRRRTVRAGPILPSACSRCSRIWDSTRK
jgi:hypothetical protein